MAFSAYRMVYASVWDFRFNHIPLTRHLPFSYGHGALGGFETTVWTRKAGWGFDEGDFGGAPFDAGSSGAGFGAATGATTGAAATAGNGLGHGHHHSGGVGRQSVDRRPVPGSTTHGDQMV